MKLIIICLFTLLFASCASKQLVKISDCDNVASDIYRCPKLK